MNEEIKHESGIIDKKNINEENSRVTMAINGKIFSGFSNSLPQLKLLNQDTLVDITYKINTKDGKTYNNIVDIEKSANSHPTEVTEEIIGEANKSVEHLQAHVSQLSPQAKPHPNEYMYRCNALNNAVALVSAKNTDITPGLITSIADDFLTWLKK